MDYIKAFIVAIIGGGASLLIRFLVKILVDNPKKKTIRKMLRYRPFYAF